MLRVKNASSEKRCLSHGANLVISQETLDAKLASGEFIEVKRFPCGGAAAIYKFTFNYAILADLGELGYGRRWCFHDRVATMCALDDWEDFDASPDGWHREVHTGIRRDVSALNAQASTP